jgi:predicted transcriptional regulator YheO
MSGAASRTAAGAVRQARRPDPALTAERRQLMNALHPVVRMLGTIVGRHVEVVLHDLTRPRRSIVAIANGQVSGRSIGQSILSGPKEDRGFEAAQSMLLERGEAVHSVIGGYPTLSRTGSRLKSSTVVFRDSAGEPFAALCLNADLGVVEAAHAWLGQLLQPARTEPPAGNEEPQLDVLMQEIISDAVHRLGKPVKLMNREEKIQAVRIMMQRGLFIVKGGVAHAAEALGVTRFTIYNYLDALRASGVASSRTRTAGNRSAR